MMSYNVRSFTNDVYDICLIASVSSLMSVFSLMRCMTSVFGMTCICMTYIVRFCAINVHSRLTVHNIEGLLAECLCLMSIGRMSGGRMSKCWWGTGVSRM